MEMSLNKNFMNGKIPFMRWRLIAIIFSLVFMLASLVSLAIKGLNFGIDFTGGTLVELSYQTGATEADISQLRDALQTNGFSGAAVSYFGSNQEVLVRVEPQLNVSNAQVSENVINLARQNSSTEVSVRRVEFVGPKVGEELIQDGGLAVLYALIGIVIYIGFRFEWRFAISSIAALVHDVLITLGIFSLLGLSFDLTVLAAILAVVGYSLNDTIVVFDRIRETFIETRSGEPIEIVNQSLNDMLSRTLVTSLTTLLVLFSLFYLGGEIIHDFAIALILGVIIGTYSSVYIASSISLALGINKMHLIPPKKEGVSDQNEEMLLRQQIQRQVEMEQEGPGETTSAKPKRARKPKSVRRKKR